MVSVLLRTAREPLTQPDATYAERLSELAEREHFLKDWKLVGSMTLVGDLESAKAEIAELFRREVVSSPHGSDSSRAVQFAAKYHNVTCRH